MTERKETPMGEGSGSSVENLLLTFRSNRARRRKEQLPRSMRESLLRRVWGEYA